jgi:tRNA (guanine10-N2)-dimethyltransferase
MAGEWVFDLGGEQPQLARAELTELLAAAGCAPAFADAAGLRLRCTLARPPPAGLLARLGMVRSGGELAAAGSLAELEAAAAAIDLHGARFAVRCSPGPLEPQAVNQRLGAALAATGRVDLEQPEITIRVFQGDTLELELGREPTGYRRCLKHHLNRRPRFAPVSLPPRLARAMVNLALPSGDGQLLDPFCGTGGLLIEAADCGLAASGGDYDGKMVSASRENLRHFGHELELEQGDAATIVQRTRPAAIATDPPYGRSASTAREPLGELLARFSAACAEALPTGGRLVLALPDPALLPQTGFSERHRCEWYVHGSLTRHLLVLERD